VVAEVAHRTERAEQVVLVVVATVPEAIQLVAQGRLIQAVAGVVVVGQVALVVVAAQAAPVS